MVVGMGSRPCIVVGLIGWLFLCVCVCVVVDVFLLGACLERWVVLGWFWWGLQGWWVYPEWFRILPFSLGVGIGLANVAYLGWMLAYFVFWWYAW